MIAPDLKTPALSGIASLPRPEYPRPQFARGDWLNLNGTWEFEFDDRDVGLRDDWAHSVRPFANRIRVPFAFETKLSGIGDSSFHSCVWYRRKFSVPKDWNGKLILLHFGAVDYHAAVWVNGILVATHEGGHTPFQCEIAGTLKKGKGTVVVRAQDPATDRYIPRGKQHWEEQPAGIFYARTTGIWQSVWLEPVPQSYLQSARITPHRDGSLLVETCIVNPGESQFVRATVTREGKPAAQALSLADGPRARIELKVPEPDLWSPDAPNLYDLSLELGAPEGTVDIVRSYCGFRSVSTADGQIFLNGMPCYLKTVLDQGYWPDSNLTPPSDEAIEFDLRAAKAMGFNGVRKHQKVEDPRYLYWADRLGMLVSAEMANAYLFNSDAVARITREWIEVVNRDYNHPCIVIWVPINESWGVPNIGDPSQRAHLKALYYLTKSLDNTRLVIDNDGWEHTEVTDLFAIHDYTTTGAELLARYAAHGVPATLINDLHKFYLAPGHSYNGSPVFLSEFGGIAYVLPDDRAKVPPNAWGYSGVEGTQEEALERIGSLYRAISRIQKIRGICYTQLYDVEQEVNGLLTYDRRCKFDPALIANFNSLMK
jgi:beta-galactosidase/beta-glucuronidase